MLSWWLDSTEPSMQEIIYKIILEGTALFGQNCWDSVETFELSSRTIYLVYLKVLLPY